MRSSKLLAVSSRLGSTPIWVNFCRFARIFRPRGEFKGTMARRRDRVTSFRDGKENDMAAGANPLASFLVSLADPRNLRAYRQNPDDYLERFGVSEADRAAIASASPEVIRQRAAGLGNVAV